MFASSRMMTSRVPAAAASGGMEQVSAREAEINKVAAKLWGITDDELKVIQEVLTETDKSKRAGKEDEED